jgi:hypothetical protein
MLKWLRDRNASQRVGVIESLQLDGKRTIKLVRRTGWWSKRCRD